jgi:hypothetical protein
VSVLSLPPQDELELLIREARARQRKRKVLAAATVAAAAAGVLAVYSVIGGGTSATRTRSPLAVAPPPACRSSELRLSWLANGAATGKSFLNFTFTNVSPSTCALRGWARLGVVLRDGRRIALRAGRIPNQRHTGKSVPPRRTVLRPGRAASFNVLIPDQLMYSPPPKCLRTRATLVLPPGANVALRIDKPLFEYCGQRFEGVTPLVPGLVDRYMA